MTDEINTPRTDNLATRRAYAIGRGDLAVCWKEMHDHACQLERELTLVTQERDALKKKLEEMKILSASTFHGGPWIVTSGNSLGFNPATQKYDIERYRLLFKHSDGTYDSDDIKFLTKEEAEAAANSLNRIVAIRALKTEGKS